MGEEIMCILCGVMLSAAPFAPRRDCVQVSIS